MLFHQSKILDYKVPNSVLNFERALILITRKSWQSNRDNNNLELRTLPVLVTEKNNGINVMKWHKVTFLVSKWKMMYLCNQSCVCQFDECVNRIKFQWITFMNLKKTFIDADSPKLINMMKPAAVECVSYSLL